MKKLVFFLMFVLAVCFVSAEVLVLSVNKGEFSTGETAKVFGYVLSDSLEGQNATPVSIYLDNSLEGTPTTDPYGYYEFSIQDVQAGEHNLTANTSSITQKLTFNVEVVDEEVIYEILASSLVVSNKNTLLNFTVNKYLGTTLTNHTYNYSLYNTNGTQINASLGGVSGVLEYLSLPTDAGYYTIIIDNKKSFTASVAKFSLKYSIIDQAGNQKVNFKPNGVAYFQVEGYSNGQKISNATVTVVVTDPNLEVKTITFTEKEGIYYGNTNMSNTTAIQLKSGDYELIFKMKDSSNNEQSVKGFFTVLGLDVKTELVEKRPYVQGESAIFDITVKNLENGNLLSHNSTTYFIELEKNGKLFDVSTLTKAAHTDAAKTSRFTFVVPSGLEDGQFFLKIKASSGGKTGRGKEYIEIMNTQLFIQLTDNFQTLRENFKPSELAKLSVISNRNMSLVAMKVYNALAILQSSSNTTPNSTSSSISFNTPSSQGDYYVSVEATTNDGIVKKQKWFKVQNYQSFLDVRDLNNNPKFIQSAGSSFFGQIKVFDIGTGSPADISSFVIKFDKIVNEKTLVEYTNIQATENSTYSDRSTGKAVYLITPSTLTNGVYRIEYTIADTQGKSFKGKGWFGISAFDVDVKTYDENNLQKYSFSAGKTINVSINLSTGLAATATLYREFFGPITFNIINGQGSTLLTSAGNKLPTQPGYYPFGLEVVALNGDTGLGAGFFEIKNLNFKTITVRNNGQFDPTSQIIADIVTEKSGELVNSTNVTLIRLVRISDKKEISALSSSALTDSLGRTSITITPSLTLEKGDYFAEIKAAKDNDNANGGFGFRVVADKVSITLSDADKKFSQTENIEISVLVTLQNDTPRNNVTVNLTGLLNLNTWASVSATKQATTASNGIASLTISASNYNTGKYAPVVAVDGMANSIVGFGSGEFEIESFSANVTFQQDSSFSIDEDILLNIAVTGSVTVTAAITDHSGNAVSADYYYSGGILTVNNNLASGEYFIEVSVVQSSKTVTKKLWFEVIAPWAYVPPLTSFSYEPTDTLQFSYTVFTSGSSGWRLANGTINITSIENSWTGEDTILNLQIDTTASGSQGAYNLSLTSYNLQTGDYVLRLAMVENPAFSQTLYFKVDKNVKINILQQPPSQNNYIILTINTTGLSENAVYALDSYYNYDGSSNTINGTNITSGQNVEFGIYNLQNGFYQANIRVIDGADTYYINAFFEIRVREITISAPDWNLVNNNVTFNITSSISSTFWLIDPFSQKILLSTAISPGQSLITYYFNSQGWYVFGYGTDKWEAYKNSDWMEIRKTGFNVQWPFNQNKFVQSGNVNFTFNVSSDLINNPLTLKLKNIFSGAVITKTDITTGPNPGEYKAFSYSLADLGLTNGPHDIELTLEDSSAEQPKQFFFIDIFSTQYEMWAWPSKWEVRSGENVTVNVEVFDILNNWQKVAPDNVTLDSLKDPFGQNKAATLLWSEGNNFALISTQSNWVSGNYQGEIRVLKGSVEKIIPFNFFIKGNDNLQLFWFQNKWEYASSDTFSLRIDVRDKGAAISGISAALESFELRPENWNDTSISKINSISGYNFSTADNKTNSEGKIIFYMPLTGLSTGGYSGRLNIGGQIVWFDFNIRTYQVDAYTEQWEYGITDTIEVNVRARDILTWAPIQNNGNVTVKQILKHEQNNWQPIEIPLSYFGITDSVFDVTNGEALVEMSANQSALALDKAYDFEVKLEMNLNNSGISQGWSWFRLSNGTKPGAIIVDSTGETPDSFFGGQVYTLEVTGATSATLKNIWGPNGRSYNMPLTGSETLEVNFTSPDMGGWYTMEIELFRTPGFPEYIYEDFVISGGTELNVWSDGNVIPDVNFTVYVSLSGQGEDPFCGSMCPENSAWFGPLANKTITLEKLKDLESFTDIDLSGLNIQKQTNTFPSWMIPQQNVACGSINNQPVCEENENCVWDVDSCKDMAEYCGDLNPTNDDDCTSAGCFWDGMNCGYDGEDSQPGVGGGNNQEMGMDETPGMAAFNLNPTVLGMVAGKKYDLVFSYIDDSAEEIQGKVFVQVEKFHVAISKRESNLGAGSDQYVWLMAQNLNGTPLVNCTILFTSIYGAKDYKLVKSININQTTGADGSIVFSYTTPSLPGDYFVEGSASCLVNGQLIMQDSAYFISVGSKNLNVDMKNKFNENENIKILITSLDRTGLPKQQKFELNLFHDRDDYSQPVYSLGGSDCIALDANQNWDYYSGGGSMVNNRLELETDENGKAEIELCALPRGPYKASIYPLFDYGMSEGISIENMGPKNEEDGFNQNFVVSSADITVQTGYIYMVGGSVQANITVLDENDEPLNGSITTMEFVLTDFSSSNKLRLWKNSEAINLTNGSATVEFVIPSAAPAYPNLTTNFSTGLGDVGVFVLVQDQAANKYSYENMVFVVKNSAVSKVVAPLTIKNDRLMNVYVNSTNNTRTKIQVGVFFLRENAAKEKDWFIEGGVILPKLEGPVRGGNFKILSPKEPGNYYLGMIIYDLSVSSFDMTKAKEMLITPVEVTLDLVNITGNVTTEDGGTPISGAIVKIGKVETTTDATGLFAMQIPKGKYAVEIEKKVGTELRQFMKTDNYNFESNADIQVNFYSVVLTGSLRQTLFNISSPSTDLSTMKLMINMTINNTGGANLSNFTIQAMAKSGEEIKQNDVLSNSATYEFFQNLYAGFKTGDYEMVIKFKDEDWNSAQFITIAGNETNSTVGAILKKSYSVWTYATAGDGLDNDGDCSGFVSGQWCENSQEFVNSCTDEEKDNNKDDDCDGRIDEDLEGKDYIEYCGNGFCSAQENNAGNCLEDCSQGYCDDGICQPGEESWCIGDCSGTVVSCDIPNQCIAGESNFCNMWNISENAPWCGSSCDSDNCWACSDSDACTTSSCIWDVGGFCFKNETCSDDKCFACKTSGECTGTSNCEWGTDQYNPNGGWCNRIYSCDYECAACTDSGTCFASTATMDGVGCRWKSDYGGSWCEWNFTWQIIVNNSVCGNDITEMGEQCDDGNANSGDGCSATCQNEGNLSANGVACTLGNQCQSSNCVDGYCCNSGCGVACNTCAKVGNLGTCTPVLSADDNPQCTGANTCNAGGSCVAEGGSPNILVDILQPYNFQNISTEYVFVVYNISGNMSGFNRTHLYIDNGTNYNRTEINDIAGINTYNFTNVSQGLHIFYVDLIKFDNSIMSNDSVNFTRSADEPPECDQLLTQLDCDNGPPFCAWRAASSACVDCTLCEGGSPPAYCTEEGSVCGGP